MGTSPTILQVLNSTTNPGNSLAGKRYLGCPLLHRGLPKTLFSSLKLARICCGFNTYNIFGDDLMSLTSLQGKGYSLEQVSEKDASLRSTEAFRSTNRHPHDIR